MKTALSLSSEAEESQNNSLSGYLGIQFIPLDLNPILHCFPTSGSEKKKFLLIEKDRAEP